MQPKQIADTSKRHRNEKLLPWRSPTVAEILPIAPSRTERCTNHRQ